MISYRLVGFRRDFCISKRIFFANALLGALLTLIYSVDYSSLYHQVTIDLYASARSCYLFQSWPIYALLTFRSLLILNEKLYLNFRLIVLTLILLRFVFDNHCK